MNHRIIGKPAQGTLNTESVHSRVVLYLKVNNLGTGGKHKLAQSTYLGDQHNCMCSVSLSATLSLDYRIVFPTVLVCVVQVKCLAVWCKSDASSFELQGYSNASSGYKIKANGRPSEGQIGKALDSVCVCPQGS